MSYPQVKLGQIAVIKGGKRLPKGEELIETKTDYPYIRAQDIRDGRISFNEPTYITSEVHRKIKNYTVKTKDVCITIVGANVGDVGIVPPFLDGANLTENAVKLTNLKDYDPVFLNYSLLGSSPQSQMKLLAAGVAQPKLGLYKVADIDIPYPPLPTQRKIAAILSAYDDLIENNTRRIAILEAMARLIYREWFVHFRFPGHENVRLFESELGPVPEGWEVTRLGDIAQEIRRRIEPEEVEPETPYVGLEHIPRKSIALTDWGKVDQVQSTKLIFKKGEILFGKIRPYFHKVVIAPVAGVCSTDAIVILPKKAEHFSVLLCCVSSEHFV